MTEAVCDEITKWCVLAETSEGGQYTRLVQYNMSLAEHEVKNRISIGALFKSA